MSIKTTESVIKRFLERDEPEVLALTGAWGVGKTFAWNKILGQVGESSGLKSYAYVSLFGMSSIAQLRMTIMIKSQPLAHIGKPLDLNSLNAGWFGRAKVGAKHILGRLESFRETSWGRNVTLALETLAPFSVSKTIVCLDDFERLKLVAAEEILGLMSELKEERGCKVVLIFNADELTKDLNAASAYAAYREKVVDIEIRYAPTIEEAFDLVFEPAFPYREQIALHVRELGLTNIRVLRKTKASLNLVLAHLINLHDHVIKAAIATAVLFCWFSYQPDVGKPRLRDILRWKPIISGLGGANGVVATPAELEWTKTIREYGFLDVDEVDIAIGKIIENGYIDGSGLIEAASSADIAARVGAISDRFSAAWSKFHNSFSNNGPEVIDDIFNTAILSVNSVSLSNLDSTVRILRELGASDRADELIKTYVNAQTSPSALDVEHASIFGPIEDDNLLAAVADAHAKLVTLPTLEQTVPYILTTQSWTPSHIETLMNASENEIFDFLMHSTGPNLNVVKVFLHSGSGQQRDSLREKTMVVLNRISETSAINRLRVKRLIGG